MGIAYFKSWVVVLTLAVGVAAVGYYAQNLDERWRRIQEQGREPPAYASYGGVSERRYAPQGYAGGRKQGMKKRGGFREKIKRALR